MQALPLIPSVPNDSFVTTIAGSQYVVGVRWNGRAESWYLDLLSEDETPIAAGMRIVLGAFLGVRSVHPDFPLGTFLAVDLSGEGREAGLDDLGERVKVFFVPLEDLV